MMQTRFLTHVGILSALASVLMFLSVPLPFLPDFLRLDLAELPALIGLFILGPAGGIAIEGIKNLIHLVNTRTFGIGEFANFIVGSSFILGTYWGIRSKFGTWLSLALGVVVLTLCAAIVNLFILIPLYSWALGIPIEALVKLGQAANPQIVDLVTLIIWGIVPFNLVKGILVASTAAVVLPRLKKWLEIDGH